MPEYLPLILLIAFLVSMFVIVEIRRRLSLKGGLYHIQNWYEKEKATLPSHYRQEIGSLINQLTGEEKEKPIQNGGSCCSSGDSQEDRALERLYFMMEAANERDKYESIKEKLGLELKSENVTPLADEDMRVIYVDVSNEEMFLIGKLDKNTYVAKDKDDNLHDLVAKEFRTPARLAGKGIGCSCTSMGDKGDVMPEQYITIRPKLVNEKSLDKMFLIKGKTLDGKFVAEDTMGRMFKLNNQSS